MNACIVGLGAVGPVHAAAVNQTENAQVYAVCDIEESRAYMYGEKYGCRIYRNYEEVLRDGNIDVVHICTPHFLHFDMITRALYANKHVIAEKPVVMRPEEFYLLKKKAEAAKTKLCCVVQNRENPCIVKMLEIVKSENDGKLLGIFANLRWHRDAAYYASALWRGKWDTEGGGLIINQAIHLLDIFCLLGGKVKSMQTTISNRGIPEIEVEDSAEGYFEFESGVRGIFTASNTYPVNLPFMVELDFERAVYRYSDGILTKISNGKVDILSRDVRKEGEKFYWGTGHTAVVSKFYNAVSGGSEIYTTLSDIEETMKVMFEFYRQGK